MEKKNVVEVSVSQLKEMILKRITEKHGDMNAFLETDIAKEIGVRNIKTYLYPSGAVSYPALMRLCEYFGIGELHRETVVSRTITYSLKQLPIPRKILAP